MKTTVLGALLGAGLLTVGIVVFGDGGEAIAGRAASYQSSPSASDLIALSETFDQKHQQVTLIDPKMQVICVYHIDLSSGTIALQSVRNFRWDLQLTDFNGTNPLSREVQSLSEQR